MPSSEADSAGLPRRSPEAISVGQAAMACCGRHTHCVSNTEAMPRPSPFSQTLSP